MAAPVDDGSMYWPHDEVNGQQEEERPVHVQKQVRKDVEHAVQHGPARTRNPRVAYLFDEFPLRIIPVELLFDRLGTVQNGVVDVFGCPHHRENVFRMMGRVRVAGGIAEGVVHPVQHRIGAGAEVRRPLRDVRQGVEKTLPEFAHREHFMRRVTMQEERLAEQRQIPVSDKGGQYNHRG